MTTSSPRRIPRRRDSSRQAAFTFLTNISLGTESSYPPSNSRATAAPSHSVPSPFQSSDSSLNTDTFENQPPPPSITLRDHDTVSGNSKPSLQINTRKTSIPYERVPKKSGGNYVLSPSSKTANNNNIFKTKTSPIDYNEEFYDFDRERSNSHREDSATSFLANISLDPKRSKPYHPSRENLTSPIKEKIAILEASDNLIPEIDDNQVNIIDSLSLGEIKKSSRRSSASTSKSDTSSSSANSTTPHPSPTNEKSVSHYKSQHRRHSPILSPNSLNKPNVNDNRKQNNANNSSSLGLFSIWGGYDKKFKQKNRQDQMKQPADLEIIKRRKAESFAHLLVPSHSLGPEESFGKYDPTYLDDPKIKIEKPPVNEVQVSRPTKHRTVLSLSGLMGSLMHHHNNRPSDLKRESNTLFRQLHPEVDSTLTLSQIRKIKLKLLNVARNEDLDLELSTIAKAYAYFEKLILKKLVNKANRRLIGAICLLLASKVNEPMGMSYSPLLEALHKNLDVTIKDITDKEFSVFANLDFELYLSTQEFMPHFDRLFQTLDYNNKEEYLGNNPFYEFHLIGNSLPQS
ncbi:17580_t:CDS:10 [Funneliformis caledonium]|uniref:17580_t:CDS:1 n=1 Tax=Funneliformis caledonium TaxID=1117310 RepID=A0A9N9AH12_9GLOM|nr:17580_t:CDS:10 [Funneliformis caledonium]